MSDNRSWSLLDRPASCAEPERQVGVTAGANSISKSADRNECLASHRDIRCETPLCPGLADGVLTEVLAENSVPLDSTTPRGEGVDRAHDCPTRSPTGPRKYASSSPGSGSTSASRNTIQGALPRVAPRLRA